MSRVKMLRLASVVVMASMLAGCAGAVRDAAPDRAIGIDAASPMGDARSADSSPSVSLETDVPQTVTLLSGQDNWFNLASSAYTLAFRTPQGSKQVPNASVFSDSDTTGRRKVGGYSGVPNGYAMSLDEVRTGPDRGYRISVKPGEPSGESFQVEIVASSWEDDDDGWPDLFLWPDER